VYNRKPIVILDDILKGLDADTYSKCFAAILGPEGLLRKQGTAVLLATHNIQLLPHADHIIVLNEEGRIVQQGSFDKLSTSDGYVSRLGLKKSVVQEAAARVAEEEEREENEKEKVLVKMASKKEAEKARKAAQVGGKSRGRRNADAMSSYIRSMGKVAFPSFCFLTICNVGFRAAQRESLPMPFHAHVRREVMTNTTETALWLNVWTSANEQNPDSKTGYYIGIYVLFAILTLAFLTAQFW
jgi:ATP-binding cassette subfamily C (CFTR/MRP) protein 1